MPPIEWLGLLAGAFTTSSFLAQVIHSWKTKDTRSVSLTMYVAFTTGVVFWIIYGWATHSTSVLFWNSIGLCLTAMVIGLKLKYK